MNRVGRAGSSPQMEVWNRLGPARYRITQLLLSVVLGAFIFVVPLAFSTVKSFYHGTGVIHTAPIEQSGVAGVRDCVREGPVSSSGFGYWWKCRVVVRMSDGRVIDTTVDHSIVTPKDVGRDVPFREACSGDNNTRCRYGRPSLRIWAVSIAALNIVETALWVAIVIVTACYVLRGLLGAPLFFRILGKVRRTGARSSRGARRAPSAE